MAATITKDTTNNVWVFADTITNSSYNVVFNTINRFTDANIKAQLTVQSGTINKPIISNTNLGTYFDTGTSSSNSVSITPSVTNTAGFIAAHGSGSPVTGDAVYYTIKTGEGQANTADVALYTTDGSKAGINVSSIVKTGDISISEPDDATVYYLAFTGSGSSKIKTTGWMTAGTTLTAATKTKYFPITKAVLTVSKTGGSITPSASLSKSNIEWSTSNTSGVSVTATGNGSVSNLSIKANVSADGYIPTGDVATASSLSIAAAGTPATETKYITGVTIASGKSFAVTNSGTTTVTAGISGSTTAGVINIVAYPSSGTTADASKKIVDGGRWVEQTISAAGTWYYGKVKANSTSVVQTNVTTVNSSNVATRATATWGNGFITSGSIAAATFANSATANVTYVDISNTSQAPVLIAGDYLYINRGYVDNLKISLARLIPDTLDGNNINFAPANYILTGYAAFDAAGAQITGTMQIYNGAYTVS